MVDKINNKFLYDFFKSHYSDQEELLKEDQIFSIIVDEYSKEFKNGNHIEFCYNLKKLIEAKFLNKYGFERTTNGFEHRSNFRFDPETQNITFDRNKIMMFRDEYRSDRSQISDEFLRNHAEELETYMKAYNAIDNYYYRYEKVINSHLQTDYDNNTEEKIHEKISNRRQYLLIFGEVFNDLLIKWLNLINNPENNLEELLDEFNRDVNNAEYYFENTLAKDLRKYYGDDFSFRSCLLKELDNYSTLNRTRVFKENIDNKKIK